MKTIKLFLLTILISFTGYSQAVWELDKAHTKIRFSALHMLVTEVEGNFNEFEGKITTSSQDFSGSKISFTAKVSSIDTDNERRDNHLKSDDFFNAEEYPELTFDGTLNKEGDQYYLVGDLTIRGTKKQVKLDVKYNGKVKTQRGSKAGFKITGTINRFDYGLKWNRALETGGLVVSENIDITCNIEANLAE